MTLKLFHGFQRHHTRDEGKESRHGNGNRVLAIKRRGKNDQGNGRIAGSVDKIVDSVAWNEDDIACGEKSLFLRDDDRSASTQNDYGQIMIPVDVRDLAVADLHDVVAYRTALPQRGDFDVFLRPERVFFDDAREVRFRQLISVAEVKLVRRAAGGKSEENGQ